MNVPCLPLPDESVIVLPEAKSSNIHFPSDVGEIVVVVVVPPIVVVVDGIVVVEDDIDVVVVGSPAPPASKVAVCFWDAPAMTRSCVPMLDGISNVQTFWGFIPSGQPLVG